MRIAINTRFLLKGKMEGFGWFTYETVKRLVKDLPEHDFFFFFDRPFDPKYIFADNVTPIVLSPPARHPILFKIWFDYSVTRAIKKYKIDCFYSPDGYLSLKTKVPQIGVIHDLNFEHYPEDLRKRDLNYLKKYFPLFAKKAAHLLTVSEFSKNDIVTTYGISPEKITVSLNGASDAFQPISTIEKEKVRAQFSTGLPYFLFVGALHQRKNLNRLLEAYTLFKQKTNSPTQLLIVGTPLWKNPAFEEKLKNFPYAKDLHFTGHVALDELTRIMAAAHAFTFVSYFEGFGIPLAEAMKAGTPILSGNKTALPEVAGDAALYVDPFSIEEISNGLIEMDSNAELRAELSKKGLERGKRFNWDHTADQVKEVLMKYLQ